jgi:hypothetical protein
MGGVAGHMSHPWEVTELTFKDLKSIVTEICSGGIKAYEKVDGINMHFTVDANGRARFARNGTEIREGGVNFQQLESQYQNHPARDVIVEGCRYIAETIQQVWWPLGFTRKNWVNCDIVLAERPQLIKYDNNLVVLHGALAFESSGKRFEADLSEQFSKLLSEMSEYQGTAGSGWSLSGPIEMSLPLVTGDGVLAEALMAINTVQGNAGVGDSSRVRDYVKRVLSITNLRGIREELLELAVANLCEEKNHVLLKDIKKLCTAQEYFAISEVCKKERAPKVLGEVLKPLEACFMRFGSRYLANVRSALIEDVDTERARLIDLYETTIIKSASEAAIPADSRKKFESYVARMNSLELDISPIEGFVFEWAGNTIKLTGTFSLLNRVVGMLKFQKPLTESKPTPLPFLLA